VLAGTQYKKMPTYNVPDGT